MTRSDGYLLIDKASSATSHDAVAAVRRHLHMKRVGHTGTLDPFATGLLLVLTGRATRLAQYLVGLPKTYTGTIRLGVRTDTDDVTGTVLSTAAPADLPAAAEVREAVAAMVGRQEQVPPQFSAKKVGGNRAFAMARRGAAVALSPVEVEVFAFDVTEQRDERVDFVTEVSSGTYIRALARDLGTQLGCGAHLEALRRTRVGSFDVTDAIPLDRLGDDPVQPSVEAVGHLAQRVLDADERDLIVHGRPIAGTSAEGEAVALVFDGALLGIAETAGDRLKPKVVLADG